MPVYDADGLNRSAEGRYYSPKMQWWCGHAQVVDQENRSWSFYYWPSLGSLDECWICSLHTSDRVIDLTTLHLPVGTIQTSRDGVDVRYGANRLYGAFPKYAIHVEGKDGATPLVLDLAFEAEASVFQALKHLTGITWHYIPRMSAAGTLRLGDKLLKLKGHGYYERRRGRFWAPGNKMALWESIPYAGSEGMSIPLFYKVWRNDGSPALQTMTFTLDGRTLIHFPEVDVDIQETRKFPGFDDVDHPMRFRLAAKGADGHAEVIVTRSPHRIMMRNYLKEPFDEARTAGMYGPGHTEGHVVYRGKTYTVKADSYGSALYFRRAGQ